ncbi:ATP-dependent nuclease [Niallia endozanthoxylica]|uniref:ATP-dependent nuclease n=1 Tax=Niallia endozanthoxylica TaxID=2036016 RepID=UPI00168BE36B|nr:AAA family ATPase [Niallia endozanthoxylica]
MILKKLTINNFRSIAECTITCGKLSALVGENNSGKSGILRALNAFFNYEEEEEHFKNGSHQYSNQRLVRIELTFGNIPDKEYYIDKIYNQELILRMTYSHNARNKRRTIQYKINGSYQNISNDFIEQLKNDINYVLIPTSRDHKQVIWAENALLKTVLEAYFKKHTSRRDSLSPKVKEAARNFEKLALSKVEKSLSKYYSLTQNFDFKLNHNKMIDYSILLNDISLSIEEKGQNYNITESGSGIQSLTIIALYRYLAEIKHNNIILGIEEPEINLHPQAQRQFIKSIKENNEAIHEIQTIFTTHSAVIVDQLEHNELILFRKVEDRSRGFKTIAHQVPDNFWEKHDIEEFKYYQFYRYKNSEFFFAKFIIIVESKNDAEVVKFLLEQKNIDPDLYGVSIIDLGGVNNLRYPFHLLNYLKIPHFIILDKDFFIPYYNDSLENSRYDNGFPKYRNEYKNENLELIKELIPKKNDRDRLLNLFKTNHSKAMDLLEKYNIISMMYNLEIDLVGSKTATKVYHDLLIVPREMQENPSQKFLLTERKGQIKQIKVIMNVISELQHKNLPNSYKRIKKIVSERIKSLNK